MPEMVQENVNAPPAVGSRRAVEKTKMIAAMPCLQDKKTSSSIFFRDTQNEVDCSRCVRVRVASHLCVEKKREREKKKHFQKSESTSPTGMAKPSGQSKHAVALPRCDGSSEVSRRGCLVGSAPSQIGAKLLRLTSFSRSAARPSGRSNTAT